MKTGKTKGIAPWNKGKKCPQISRRMAGRKISDEIRKRMSEAKKRNPTKYWLGKERPEMKVQKYALGYKHTEEAKKKISEASKGNKYCLGLIQSKETIRKRVDKFIGEKHWKWKGEDVGYRSLHHWVIRNLGKAKRCSICGKEGTGREIHWANIDHKYRRNTEDFIEMCAECHGEYDKKNNLRRRK